MDKGRPIHDFIPDLLDVTASLRITQQVLKSIALDAQGSDGVSSPLYIIINKHLDHTISDLTKITGDDSVERYAKYYDDLEEQEKRRQSEPTLRLVPKPEPETNDD